MDPDWVEVSRVLLPAPGVRALHTPVTTVAFDTSYELLWAGNEYGRVTSFFRNTSSHELTLYTSFKAHTSHDGNVHQIIFNDRGVIALGSRSIHMALRTGPPIWTIRQDDMRELRCMTFTSKSTSEILVAGEQDKMFVIDVNKGEVIRQIATNVHYKLLRSSRYIFAATTGSHVNILDPTSFVIINTWAAHFGSVSDLDAQNDYIITCGKSPRQQGYSMFDPLFSVFDLKNMRPLPPVPFPAGAAFARLHPRMSSTSIVVSQNGQLHVVDVTNPNSSNVRQANSMSMRMLEVAPSGEALALVDNECYIHLWGSPGKIRFVDAPKPLELPNHEESTPQLDWSDDTPLSSIGMPYYKETLLSAWPQDGVYVVGAPPSKEDPQFLMSLQRRDWGYYGKNTQGGRRNQTEDLQRSIREQGLGILAPRKFLSEQAKELAHSPAGTPALEEPVKNRIDEKSAAAIGLQNRGLGESVTYEHIDIKFSKYGIDDFDFKFYNRTPYSGLQNHVANSYINALLQIMRFTPVIRNVALEHASTKCFDEICLLCELGFLFDMLEKAGGTPVHASNLLRIFSYHPQAVNLGLLEDTQHATSLPIMLQNFARFILDKIVNDHKRICFQSGTMEKLLETSATNSIRCVNCGSETSRPTPTLIHELIYPNISAQNQLRKDAKLFTFSQVLKMSVERDLSIKGWCQRCHKYQTLNTKRIVHNIPKVLVLSTCLQSATEEQRKLWAAPGWLPAEIGMIVSKGQFCCYQGQELKNQLRAGHAISVYSLVGVAAEVESQKLVKGVHLVGLANVSHSMPEPPGTDQWHLFNDFHVRSVGVQEALDFKSSKKTPSVVVFHLKEANNQIDSTWKDNLDTNLLYIDLNPNLQDKTYRTLDKDRENDMISPDFLIAIDTEFVSIKRQQIDVFAGSTEIARPTVHALARASVLRGTGEDEGVPFIDDYVHIQEPVVNYLTEFSGIAKEDLDPMHTRHNLVPLKITFKKIWILLNLGCKFVGHGLKQDFHVINIHVPEGQIIDTSQLFYWPERKRKLSLQFLAWCLLKEEIQQETHDSIEDSRTALRLYRKYEEYVDAGILEAMMQDIWNKGVATNFKVPGKDAPIDGPQTPGRNVGLGTNTAASSPARTPVRMLSFR